VLEKKQKQPFNVINRTGGSGVVGHFGNRDRNTRRLPPWHRAGLAPKTVNNHLAVLRKLLNLAIEWGELPHAPRIRRTFALCAGRSTHDWSTNELCSEAVSSRRRHHAGASRVVEHLGPRRAEALDVRLVEVDVTVAKQLIAEEKARTGKALSFTGFLIA
jgi:hypothetical protein